MLHSLGCGSATDCDSTTRETDVPANSQICASNVAAGEPQFEATAPVKLPTWQCPAAGSRTAVRAEITPGWYFTDDSTDASAPASKSPTYATQASPQSNARIE